MKLELLDPFYLKSEFWVIKLKKLEVIKTENRERIRQSPKIIKSRDPHSK